MGDTILITWVLPTSFVTSLIFFNSFRGGINTGVVCFTDYVISKEILIRTYIKLV